jgi:hypothetical protein
VAVQMHIGAGTHLQSCQNSAGVASCCTTWLSWAPPMGIVPHVRYTNPNPKTSAGCCGSFISMIDHSRMTTCPAVARSKEYDALPLLCKGSSVCQLLLNPPSASDSTALRQEWLASACLFVLQASSGDRDPEFGATLVLQLATLISHYKLGKVALVGTDSYGNGMLYTLGTTLSTLATNLISKPTSNVLRKKELKVCMLLSPLVPVFCPKLYDVMPLLGKGY